MAKDLPLWYQLPETQNPATVLLTPAPLLFIVGHQSIVDSHPVMWLEAQLLILVREEGAYHCKKHNWDTGNLGADAYCRFSSAQSLLCMSPLSL